MNKGNVLGAIGVILIAAAPFLVIGISIPPYALLIPTKGELSEIVSSTPYIVAAIALILLAGYLIRWASRNMVERLVFWGVAITTLLLLTTLLHVDPFVSAFLVGTAVGTVLPIVREDPCKSRLWEIVSSPKSIGFLVVFFMLINYAQSISNSLQPVLIDRIVALSTGVNGGTQGMDSTKIIDQILPPKISNEERQKIIESVIGATPNWNSLPEDQRQLLIDQYLKQYSKIREGIRNALMSAIKSPNADKLKDAIKKQIESMPVFKMVLNNAKYVFAVAGVMLYSLITLLAEIIAAALGLVVRYVAGLREPSPQN